MAAEDHFADISQNGIYSHIGSDNSTYKDRIERYALWGGSIYESIIYGRDIKVKNFTLEDVVLHLLIDDAILGRKNKNNMLDEKHREIGVSFGDHKGKPGEKAYVILFSH
jgi:uncharacterized protein YkwD